MSRCINLSVLTKHRGSLMGLAIFMIVLCHGSVCFTGNSKIAYDVLQQLFQMGVDIFLLLSGLGCCFSLSKNSKTSKFYFKRGVKILVPYCIVIAFWGVLQLFVHVETSFVGFIYKYSLVTFFLRGELSAWYVVAIIVLYTIAPFFYKLIKTNKRLAILFSLVPFIFACVLHISSSFIAIEKIADAMKIVSEIFIVRISTFLIGMLIGDSVVCGQSKPVSRKLIVSVLCICGALFVMNNVVFPGEKWLFSQWFVTRFTYLFSGVCLSLVVGDLFDKVSQKNIYRIFVWFGTITFEIYLLHEKMLMVCDKYLTENSVFLLPKSILSNVLAILLAVCLGWVTHKISSFIVEWLFVVFEKNTKKT